MRWGSVVSRFPDSPDSPSKTAPFNSLRPRVCSDYFSLEDILVFWRSGAYKKYPRSYGADHRVCGDHCPTSGHSGPRTPVNDLKSNPFPGSQAEDVHGPPHGGPLRKPGQSTGIPFRAQTRRSLGRRALLRGHLNSRAAAPRQSTHPPRRHKQERR